jgi:hypothetical protein
LLAIALVNELTSSLEGIRCAVDVQDRQGDRVGQSVGSKCRERSVVATEATPKATLKAHKRRDCIPYYGGIEWVCRRGARSSGTTGRPVCALVELSGWDKAQKPKRKERMHSIIRKPS